MLNAVITRPVLAIVIGILPGPAQPNTVVDGLIQRKVDCAAQDAVVVGARLRGLCKKHGIKPATTRIHAAAFRHKIKIGCVQLSVSVAISKFLVSSFQLPLQD